MSIELVKEVRSRSGAPLGECKSALEEAAGNVDQALKVLQIRGEAKAVAKGGRIATEGRIHTYVHGNGRIVSMVEINTETDFVARNPTFIEFCDNVAMHVAGFNPLYLNRAEVPELDAQNQRDIFIAQAENDGKPITMISKIVDGKMNKWFAEVCLLDQTLSGCATPTSVDNVRKQLVAQLGENIQIRRFTRWELGEGIVKTATLHLADEVAKLASS